MTRARTLVGIAFTLLSVASATAEDFTFNVPRHNGYRLDVCRTWGQGCGQAAADAFCRINGYERAISFEIDPKIGAVSPTMTLGDQRVCDQPQCDGFRWITCTRPGSGPPPARSRGTPPPGASGAPPVAPVSPGLLGAMKKVGPTAPKSSVPDQPPPAEPQPADPPAATKDDPGAPPPPPVPGPSSSLPGTPPATPPPGGDDPPPAHVPGVLPDNPPPPSPPPAPPAAPAPPWTPKDVMDERIDVQAQYALFRLLKGSPAQRIEASHMLSAVKAGALKGIYQEDQQVPAMRAQELGQWWGQLLPKGTDGSCVTQPATKPPVIAMRRGTPTDKAHYDASLAEAWVECMIPASWPVRPYDPSAPGDPASTGAPQECHGAEQLVAALQLCEEYRNRRLKKCDKNDFNPGKCVQRVAVDYFTCQQEVQAACK